MDLSPQSSKKKPDKQPMGAGPSKKVVPREVLELLPFELKPKSIQLINSGSQADVYHAEELGGELRHLAIKKSPRKVGIKKEEVNVVDLDISMNEVRVLSQLQDHPNILHLMFACEIKDNQERSRLLITEYCDDGDLLEFTNNNVQKMIGNEIMVRELFRPIVSAIVYAHGCGFVHRDIKLENIYLTKDPMRRVVVGDWGFSTSWRRGEILPDSLGSRHYSAPEIHLNLPYEGPEIDVWSLGIILYALLHGRLPFCPDPETKAFPIASMFNREYTLHECLSTALRKLIKVMLHPEADGRIQSENILSMAWLYQSPQDETE